MRRIAIEEHFRTEYYIEYLQSRKKYPRTGLAAMRLIWSGIFDEYPNLKIILGHLGEALPFWMWRLDYPHAAYGKHHIPICQEAEKTPQPVYQR